LYSITVLTSSRADYSIYRPLLKVLQEHPEIKLQIIAFGTHTSNDFGYTIDAIKADGFQVELHLPYILDGTSPFSIAQSIAKTVEQFSVIWEKINTDLIICLGDRYEMFSAVTASVPFSIPVAHIHGGETTLGAIDNIFRHSLTHMSRLHFTCTEEYRERVIALTGSRNYVFNTGALSIDNLQSLNLLSITEFRKQFGVDLGNPTLLTTFHPETVSFNRNEEYGKILADSLDELSDQFQVLITMPNADTMGNVIRNALQGLVARNKEKIFAFENLGTIGYLSAMKHCAMLVGNTSSGFIEASYFPKWVVNLGIRQEGRLLTENIKTIAIEQSEIINTVKSLIQMKVPSLMQPYGKGSAAIEITKHVLEFLESNKSYKQQATL
jgi:GDP/UDP-N,N'-diacetylbacillosamine 2-epimerase (hydrolysing)